MKPTPMVQWGGLILFLGTALIAGCSRSDPAIDRSNLEIDFRSLRFPPEAIHELEPRVEASGELVLQCRGRRPSIDLPVRVRARRFNVIEIRMTSESASHHAPVLRWSREGEGFLPENEMKFPPVSGEGEEGLHFLHLEPAAGWFGTIDRLRLFPTNVPGEVVVRSIRFRSLPLTRISGVYDEPSAVESFPIGVETRQVLYVPVGTAEEVPVTLGDNGLLRFGIGVPDFTWKSLEAPVTFRIRTRVGKEPIFAATLDGRRRRSDRGWHDHAVAVPGTPGKTIDLLLSTESEVESRGQIPAFFAHPTYTVPAPPDRDRPNILLISLDTLRADHLGCYGYPRSTSPWLDRFSKRAIQFQAAKSQAAKTLPSHMSLMTSLYPSVHRTIDETDALPPGWPMLGIELEKAGYHTAAFTEDAFVSAVFGFRFGFDRYHDGEFHLLSGGAALEKGGDVRVTFAERATAFLDENADRPFFLFLHTYEPHTPYCPEDAFRGLFRGDYDGPVGACLQDSFVKEMKPSGRFSEADLGQVVAVYDEEIRFTDLLVQTVLGKLDELGLRDRTMVIVTSDHGEDFDDHRDIGRHGHTLYEEILHVPLLFELPGPSRPRRVAEPVGLIDVAPTLLDWLGLEVPQKMQGKSFAPILRGEGDPEGERIVCAENRSVFQRTSLQIGPLKYVRNHGWNPEKDSLNLKERDRRVFGSTEKEELYDLGADPSERRNLAEEEPDRVEWLARVMEKLEREGAALRERGPDPVARPMLSEEMIKQLEDLGYLPGNDEEDEDEEDEE